jgi:hypothetical protein
MAGAAMRNAMRGAVNLERIQVALLVVLVAVALALLLFTR